MQETTASPTPRRGRGPKKASSTARPAGKTLSRDNALCAQQRLTDAGGLLDRSILTVMYELGPKELKQYKRLIGRAMGDILDVLYWLWERHPDIKPGYIGGPATHLDRYAAEEMNKMPTKRRKSAR